MLAHAFNRSHYRLADADMAIFGQDNDSVLVVNWSSAHVITKSNLHFETAPQVNCDTLHGQHRPCEVVINK
jgi:hypothetical protein